MWEGLPGVRGTPGEVVPHSQGIAPQMPSSVLRAACLFASTGSIAPRGLEQIPVRPMANNGVGESEKCRMHGRWLDHTELGID